MKKTYNINISGVVFTMDEDAYNLLNDYLDTLQHALHNHEEAAEIETDIEGRIAELLMERAGGKEKVVSITEIEQIITRIGSPEEMLEEEITVNISGNGDSQTETVRNRETMDQRAVPPPYLGGKPYRKLYRDPQNAMIGGVCAGFAAYLKIDVTWVRLFTVAISLLSVSTAAIIYVILWIVLPEANTPYQRMQMNGDTPTMENIGKSVTETFKENFGSFSLDPGNATRPGWKRFMDSLASIFGIVAKIILICVILVAIPLVGSFAVGILGCIFALLVLSTTWGAAMWNDVAPGLPIDTSEPVLSLLTAIGCMLVVGIPLIALIWVTVMRKHPMTKGWRISLAISWIIGFIMAALCIGMLEFKSEYEGKRDSVHMVIDKIRNIEDVDELDEINDTIGDTVEVIQTENVIIEKTIANHGDSTQTKRIRVSRQN